MNEAHTLMLSLTLYKVITILAGLAFAFMGYKLFINGIFTEAGELSTNWEDKHLVLKKAAPGTFFAVLGTLIVCVSLWRGLTLEPWQGPGGKGSGFFSHAVSTANDPSPPDPNADKTRQTVINDIALLNQFEKDLLSQSQKGKGSTKQVAVEDGDRVLDLIERAKTALMLSVWSQDWGDREEFKKWVRNAPGYYRSDPPTDIAQAATIFNGGTP